MAKYSRVAAMVTQQLERGDYRLRGFPSINQLAKEMKINPRTISKAVDELVEQGLLRRDATGRVDVCEGYQEKTMHVAVLHPAFSSPQFELALQQIRRATRQRGWQVKPIVYTHWFEPVISEAINGFDGTFFIPPSEDFPRDVLAMMKAAPNPLAVLDQNLSEHGIPSLQFFTPAAVGALLDVLKKDGHRHVMCLTVQPNDQVIRGRVEHWQLWLRMNRMKGRLIDRHIKPYDNPLAAAYDAMGELLDEGEMPETAILCTTGATAVGAMRAMIERGVQPGRDIAICAADNDAGRAPYVTPRLTCVPDPDWLPYLQVFLDWFEGREWVGPRLIQPHTPSVFVGESTSDYGGR